MSDNRTALLMILGIGRVNTTSQSMISWLRSSIFSISTDEASFVKRGFAAENATRQSHLEHCARTFIVGYNAALGTSDLDELSDLLASVDLPSRGFAYEGAGMGFALLDGVNPLRFTQAAPRFKRFLQGCGSDHLYMAYIGAGWAAARLPWVRRKLDAYVQQFDPLLRWLVYDGYGFHQGFFDPSRFVTEMNRPRELSDYALRAFDQGLGRCLWFVHGGDAEAVADTISRADAQRHADLYSGVGLAITYAGGAPPEDAEALLQRAGLFRSNVAQGAAFAAKARQRAGNMTAHTETVCRILCRTSAENAANITDQCLVDLKASSGEPAFEVWRTRIATAIKQGEGDAEPVQ